LLPVGYEFTGLGCAGPHTLTSRASSTLFEF
jgi:hypothetical protein